MKKNEAGAGLPLFENALIKYIGIPTVRLFLGWDSSLCLLQKEIKKIEQLISALKEEELSQRVNIGRVFGIEEHSSDYSVNMTLQHLSIVTNAMVFVIDTLSKEENIEKEIYIQDVKPQDNTIDESKKYFNNMKVYTNFIKNHNKKVSKMTKKHPWFVEFNNKDWAVFNYIHTVVHRRQIQAIIKKIKTQN